MSEFKPYPLATIEMNRFGHLELWRGDMVAAGKRECDVYVQLDTDVRSILESLPAHQSEAIDNGWTQETYHLSDEYFGA